MSNRWCLGTGPDVFHREEAEWEDWSTVMRAYSGLCDLQLAFSMPAAEVVASEADILSIALHQSVGDSSSSLYVLLVWLTRNEPLNIVVNSGSGEGLVAWRRLAQRHDSAAVTRLSGLLLGVMNWSAVYTSELASNCSSVN